MYHVHVHVIYVCHVVAGLKLETLCSGVPKLVTHRADGLRQLFEYDIYRDTGYRYRYRVWPFQDIIIANILLQ